MTDIQAAFWGSDKWVVLNAVDVISSADSALLFTSRKCEYHHRQIDWRHVTTSTTSVQNTIQMHDVSVTKCHL